MGRLSQRNNPGWTGIRPGRCSLRRLAVSGAQAGQRRGRNPRLPEGPQSRLSHPLPPGRLAFAVRLRHQGEALGLLPEFGHPDSRQVPGVGRSRRVQKRKAR